MNKAQKERTIKVTLTEAQLAYTEKHLGTLPSDDQVGYRTYEKFADALDDLGELRKLETQKAALAKAMDDARKHTEALVAQESVILARLS